jgi:2-methylcitrate dehydratase PrpD
MGYTGPETILEGKFGFLDAYCQNGDGSLFTVGLGKEWETARIGFKRYSCHMSASTVVEAIRELMAEHRFTGADVEKVLVEGTEKLGRHPHIPEPGDVGQAQYSVPFCAALALFRNADDPKSFNAEALADPAIRALCRKVTVRAGDRAWPSPWSTRVTLNLKDGRELSRNGDAVSGMLVKPMSRADVRRKFMHVTDALGEAAAAQLFERLEHLERESRFPL